MAICKIFEYLFNMTKKNLLKGIFQILNSIIEARKWSTASFYFVELRKK